MKKIIFGVLVALLAPFVLKAQNPTVISKPMIYSFVSTADINVPQAGGTFRLDFTMRAGWQDQYRDANGLRSFIQQELNEDEIFWLTLTSVEIGDGETQGRMTFTLAATTYKRSMQIQTATNSVFIYQAGR